VNIEINPETERLVREELGRGHFRSVDDLIVTAVSAWRERNLTAEEKPTSITAGNLSDLLLHSPFAGADLDLERSRDFPRSVDLE
jgi:Arc/MetJ-type ribon-helix-helix transcriptional regulator